MPTSRELLAQGWLAWLHPLSSLSLQMRAQVAAFKVPVMIATFQCDIRYTRKLGELRRDACRIQSSSLTPKFCLLSFNIPRRVICPIGEYPGASSSAAQASYPHVFLSSSSLCAFFCSLWDTDTRGITDTHLLFTNSSLCDSTAPGTTLQIQPGPFAGAHAGHQSYIFKHFEVGMCRLLGRLFGEAEPP
ncbi:hypothetical protein CPAR01_05928 [Colletotrichum paranaense]|uniref:Uncharacterized protein n=1 Tax=Colletotrichum paranaense TaxID=1914294 RepID=A0ABQ9SU58_9PEZI|nr:uncharacterized protein CPAR01_05928 [Colletotrichum paranaense]KAK1542541.1 hypothetical protein CPAR01_05928 [Colletotrichum paranaense]